MELKADVRPLAMLRVLAVLGCFVLAGCLVVNVGRGVPLPVEFHVANSTGRSQSFVLRVDNQILLDTTVSRAPSVTGHVISRTLMLRPGLHHFDLLDRSRNIRYRDSLLVAPQPQWVLVSFLRETTQLATGKGLIEFL